VQFARRVVESGRHARLQVLLADTALAVRQAGAAGAYSSAEQLRAGASRPDVLLWGVSCHDEADLQRARAAGADFAVVSPVRATATHPGQPPLGWAAVARLSAASPLPLYAQGGLGAADLAEARRHGAVGVAASAAEWAGAAV
jgi:8-oxo-dGTP diphosphatase